MKFKNSKMKTGMLAVSILIVGLLSLYFYASEGYHTTTQSGETFLFIKPAFAQSMSATPTFLDEEAGISLYVNISRSIDLAVAKTANWSGLEKDTADYIVGSIHLPGLTAEDDVHCFVHKTGWIVTYYLKGEPISKIVDWNLWSQSASKLTKNKLQAGLEQLTTALGPFDITSAKYYDFKYPNATKCMLIFRTLVSSGENSFNITIPNDITVYERSWSHYSQRLWNSGEGIAYAHSYFKIDGNTINSIFGITGATDPVTNRGTLTLGQLFPSAAHIVSVSCDYYPYYSYLYGVCVGLVYQEP